MVSKIATPACRSRMAMDLRETTLRTRIVRVRIRFLISNAQRDVMAPTLRHLAKRSNAEALVGHRNEPGASQSPALVTGKDLTPDREVEAKLSCRQGRWFIGLGLVNAAGLAVGGVVGSLVAPGAGTAIGAGCRLRRRGPHQSGSECRHAHD